MAQDRRLAAEVAVAVFRSFGLPAALLSDRIFRPKMNPFRFIDTSAARRYEK
jgi:hypothetical protein